MFSLWLSNTFIILNVNAYLTCFMSRLGSKSIENFYIWKLLAMRFMKNIKFQFLNLHRNSIRFYYKLLLYVNFDVVMLQNDYPIKVIDSQDHENSTQNV